jgi:hypothetical protein
VTRRFEAKSRLLDLRLAELRAAIEITRLLGPEEAVSPAPIDAQTDNTPHNTTDSSAADDAPAEPRHENEASR